MNEFPSNCSHETECQQSDLCPLSQVGPGSSVRIKHLTSEPDIACRLREMGLGEEQDIRLVSRRSNLICQVCNARLGISTRLADEILVELLPSPQATMA